MASRENLFSIGAILGTGVMTMAGQARVHVSLHNLIVEVESELAYPDQISDLANRAMIVFISAIQAAKESGVDITKVPYDDFDEDDDF